MIYKKNVFTLIKLIPNLTINTCVCRILKMNGKKYFKTKKMKNEKAFRVGKK